MPMPMPTPRIPARQDGSSMPAGDSASALLSGNMDPTDLESPMNWPLHRKIYVSAAAWLYTLALLNGATAYTAGLNFVVADFNFNPSGSATYLPEAPIAAFSLYIFGIAFAPIVTPHIAERVGRSYIYFVSITLCGLFLLGAGFCNTFGGLAACRFFAGFFGGPMVVNIEGTFADMWSARTTNTYYAFLGTAQFFGVGLGPLVGGFIVQASQGWRWTQFYSAALCALVAIFGLGISETYQREIPRRRAKREGRTLQQDPPLSGATIGQIARITVLDPLIQVFTDPIVFMATFICCFTFAVAFQWFISVPVALGSPPPAGPGFSIAHVGVAFTGVFGGAGVAALLNILIEQAVLPMARKRNVPEFAQVEYRLIPSMFGIAFITASLFWIGQTVGNPAFKPIVPIVGTAFFVLGAAMIILSIPPYLFDAYPPAGTLSALTAAAVGRVLFGGWFPLVILYALTGITPKWTLFTLGIISIVCCWPIPIIMFYYGPTLRAKSRYSKMSPMENTEMKNSHSTTDEENGYRPSAEPLRNGDQRV